jgi:RNA polymerase sigma factor (sigma-70 family)
VRQATSSSGPASCGGVFSSEFDYVLRTLRRHGVQARDAEDLVQDVFLVLCRRWSDYDPARPLRPWLAGIAFKIAHRHHQAPRNREIPCEDLEATDERDSADELLAAWALRAQVRSALAALSEKYRRVLELHELDGVPVREIATSSALPLATVHTRLRRARALFAKVAPSVRAA